MGKFSLSLFFFLSPAILQFWLLSNIKSLRFSSGHSGPVLTPSMQPMPPCSAPTCWWQTRVSGLLLHWELQFGMYSVCVCFFPLPVMLPSEIPKLPTDPPMRGFPGVWKLSLLHNSSLGWVSVPNSFVSLFVFYILSYLLSKECAAFLGVWCPLPVFRSYLVEVAQHSNDLLMNL